MEKTNLIKRTKREKNFSIIGNDILQSSQLSFGAKGLLCYVLSLPDDWVLHKSVIIKQFNIGKDALSTLFRELETEGYLVSFDMIHSDDGRWHGKNYLFYDYPQNQLNSKNLTDADFPSTGKPSTVEPSTGKPPLLNTNNYKEPIKQKNINTKRGASTITPSIDISSLIVNNSIVRNKKVLGAQPEPPTQKEVVATFKKVFAKYESWNDGDIDEVYQFFWYYDARGWELSGTYVAKT